MYNIMLKRMVVEPPLVARLEATPAWPTAVKETTPTSLV